MKKKPAVKLTLNKETVLELSNREHALCKVAGGNVTGYVWCIYPDTK